MKFAAKTLIHSRSQPPPDPSRTAEQRLRLLAQILARRSYLVQWQKGTRGRHAIYGKRGAPRAW